MFFIISSIILGANTVTSMFSSILSHRAKCSGILQVLCHEISKWKKINFIYKLKQYKRHRYLNGKALCIHYLIFFIDRMSKIICEEILNIFLYASIVFHITVVMKW